MFYQLFSGQRYIKWMIHGVKNARLSKKTYQIYRKNSISSFLAFLCHFYISDIYMTRWQKLSPIDSGVAWLIVRWVTSQFSLDKQISICMQCCRVDYPAHDDVMAWKRLSKAHCVGNPTVTGGCPKQGASNADLWCFCGQNRKTAEQTVDLLVIKTPSHVCDITERPYFAKSLTDVPQRFLPSKKTRRSKWYAYGKSGKYSQGFVLFCFVCFLVLSSSCRTYYSWFVP